MNKRFKKTAIFMAIIGFVIFAGAGYFGYQHYEIISKGTLVEGTVSRTITISSEDGDKYTPEISYIENNVQKIYTPSYSPSTNSYVVGDPVNLKMYNDKVVIDGFNREIIGIIVGFVLGLLFFIIGLIWFSHHRKRFDEVALLKRYGRKVHARFVRSDFTSYVTDDQRGIILYLQQEEGERVFQTHPIFSEFSIKWLEEHIFDVYIDAKNNDNYYIDIEKHFGHPISSQ
jgi:hypothetical protein